jgi:putative phosphoribosyl transferase
VNTQALPYRHDARLIDDQPVDVPVARDLSVGALMYRPSKPRGAVIIAQPSGICRLNRRERFVASSLARVGFLTLLVDLLTEEEDEVREGAHGDVPLLADRLLGVARWFGAYGAGGRLPLGYLGVGAGAAAALVATAIEPHRVLAVVSRESRPDYAGASLLLTRVPSLFIVVGADSEALAANRAACGLSPTRKLEVLPRVEGTFLEAELFDRMTTLSAEWFTRWLDPALAVPEWV